MSPIILLINRLVFIHAPWSCTSIHATSITLNIPFPNKSITFIFHNTRKWPGEPTTRYRRTGRDWENKDRYQSPHMDLWNIPQTNEENTQISQTYHTTLLSSVRSLMWPLRIQPFNIFQPSVTSNLMWVYVHQVGASHGYILKRHMNEQTNERTQLNIVTRWPT